MPQSRHGGPDGLIKADLPGLRVKHLTGTTASAQNLSDNIANGVDDDSIICWMASVKNNVAIRVPEGYNLGGGFEFYVRKVSGGFLQVRNAPTNAGSILTKPIDILLFYIG